MQIKERRNYVIFFQKAAAGTDRHEELQGRLSDIERAVNKMKVPSSFADQFYGLRGHIALVRERLKSS
jgi:hypothetical protein